MGCKTVDSRTVMCFIEIVITSMTQSLCVRLLQIASKRGERRSYMKSSSQFSSRSWLLEAAKLSSVNRSSYAWSFWYFFSFHSWACLASSLRCRIGQFKFKFTRVRGGGGAWRLTLFSWAAWSRLRRSLRRSSRSCFRSGLTSTFVLLRRLTIGFSRCGTRILLTCRGQLVHLTYSYLEGDKWCGISIPCDDP